MINLVFGLRDIKASAFVSYFPAVSRAVAVRLLADSVEAKEGICGKHPEDFQLFQLGEFDDQSGQFKNLNTPELVVEASSLLPVRG